MDIPEGIRRVLDAADPIDPPRLERLGELRTALADHPSAPLLFVCTHNSRRSQLTQVWARTAAVHRGFPDRRAFSGGTEATAVHPAVIATLREHGFGVERRVPGDNPEYSIRFAPEADPVACVSKTFDDPRNPRDGFVAVMTCSEADAACPSVPGAVARIALPYPDPRTADGTPGETGAYAATSRRIGREMGWLFGRLPR